MNTELLGTMTSLETLLTCTVWKSLWRMLELKAFCLPQTRQPTPFPIVKYRAGIRPESFLCIFYGIWWEWRSWANFILSSTDLRVIICDGNGHVSPARKMKFEFDHIFGHPTLQPALSVGRSVGRSVHPSVVHIFEFWAVFALLLLRVTKSMVKFKFHLPRGRNVTISIADDDPKIWWW